MPTKKPVKKESTEKIHDQKEDKTTLKKEEIKEIIEETVEETLEKLAEDPTDENVVEVGSSQDKEGEKPVIPTVVMPSEASEEETKEITEDASVEDHQTTEAVAPIVPEVTAPDAPSVEPESEKEPEKEAVAPTVHVTAPAAPMVEPLSGTESTVPVQPAKKKSSFLGIFLLIIILGVLAGGGWYAYTNKMIPTQLFSLSGITGRAVPTPTVHVSPTATPTPTVDLTKYTIAVLNGSGVPGAAAKLQNSLTTDGFTVSSTGNASTSDATDTVIAAKSTVSKGYLDKLTEELQKTYSVSATVGSLDDSATTDVTVTVGSTTAH